jgi:hypothetical protein
MSKYSPIDYWFSRVVLGNFEQEIIEKMYRLLKNELPRILSVVGERSCSLQCRHCIFQKEQFLNSVAKINDLAAAVTAIARQMRSAPTVVHEGRVFKPAHLQWLKAIRKIRPDSAIGMIDNGTYLQHVEQLESSDFKFDWLDISIDGPEAIHNRQRNSASSFAKALAGIKNAQRVLSPTGCAYSLFTLTRINHASIWETCSMLPEEVKKWHITTLSPVRPEIKSLALTEEEFAISWKQICRANAIRPLIFRTYTADDLLKLAKVAGKRRFFAAFDKAQADIASISVIIDGVKVVYYPRSICANETFVIDADSYYRLPYSVAYTLKELGNGISRHGENLNKYLIGKVTSASDFLQLYQKCAERWQNQFSPAARQEELLVFKRIKEL